MCKTCLKIDDRSEKEIKAALEFEYSELNYKADRGLLEYHDTLRMVEIERRLGKRQIVI